MYVCRYVCRLDEWSSMCVLCVCRILRLSCLTGEYLAVNPVIQPGWKVRISINDECP